MTSQLVGIHRFGHLSFWADLQYQVRDVDQQLRGEAETEGCAVSSGGKHSGFSRTPPPSEHTACQFSLQNARHPTTLWNRHFYFFSGMEVVSRYDIRVVEHISVNFTKRDNQGEKQ